MWLLWFQGGVIWNQRYWGGKKKQIDSLINWIPGFLSVNERVCTSYRRSTQPVRNVFYDPREAGVLPVSQILNILFFFPFCPPTSKYRRSCFVKHEYLTRLFFNSWFTYDTRNNLSEIFCTIVLRLLYDFSWKNSGTKLTRAFYHTGSVAVMIRALRRPDASYYIMQDEHSGSSCARWLG